MNVWQEFLNDPVIFISFVGLAIVLGLGLFYIIFFIRKINSSEQEAE